MQWPTHFRLETYHVPVQAHLPDSPQKGERRDRVDESSNKSADRPNDESETSGHKDSFQVTRQ